MKKTFLLVIVLTISMICPAQKKMVTKAKSLALQENPDFGAAREAIKEALQNDETKNDAHTWFVAGLIGYKEQEKYWVNAALGQQIDQAKKGVAVVESYRYWIVADSLSQIPVIDKKGREKKDMKTRKDIQKYFLEYWSKQDFISYGIYLNDQKDYQGAYNVFQMHLTMPNLEMMQEAKLQEQMPKDTAYVQYTYYSALFAIQLGDHNNAIRILEGLKNNIYEPITCNQLLYQEYLALQDTVHYVQVLKDAIDKYPQEPWFLQNLINHFIFSGQEAEAISYLNKAIQREPNVAQYYLIRGNLNANGEKYEEADRDYLKALELDATLADAEAGRGRIFYNQAYKMNEDAMYIADKKVYNAKLKEVNELFKKSLPFFEKAHELAPNNRDYLVTLKGLYYRFGDEQKQAEIQKKIEAL